MGALEDYYEMCKTATEIQKLSETGLMKNGLKEYEYFKGEQLLEDGILHILEDNIDILLPPDSGVYIIPTFQELLLIYESDKDVTEYTSIIDFSKFVVSLSNEHPCHEVLFPLKEMLALVFVMKTVYEVESNWHRDFNRKFIGGWKRD